ncbi:MAG: hypothetical protein ABI893_00630 [Polaromonas sp.]
MTKPRHRPPTYSTLTVLLASPIQPMPEAKRLHQLTAMYQGLNALELGNQPTRNDWAVCSDAINLMETLVLQGHVSDADGLLMDAITGLAKAGQRNLAGGAIRLDGPGIAAVRAVLADYAMVLSTLSERTMVNAHRATEKRIRAIFAGNQQSHDVQVIAL